MYVFLSVVLGFYGRSKMSVSFVTQFRYECLRKRPSVCLMSAGMSQRLRQKFTQTTCGLALSQYHDSAKLRRTG